MPITVLDAVGLSVCVGAEKALKLGIRRGPCNIVGTITAVGGGTIRDAHRRIPTVLRSELYAIPALIGAGRAAAATSLLPGHTARAGCGGGACDPDDRRPLRPTRRSHRAPLTDAWIADRARFPPGDLCTGGPQR